MEQLIQSLTSDKIVLFIILLILSLIIYFIIKRVMKLIIIALIMLGLFIGYIYYTEGKLPGPLSGIIEEGKKSKDTIDSINRAVDVIKNNQAGQ